MVLGEECTNGVVHTAYWGTNELLLFLIFFIV